LKNSQIEQQQTMLHPSSSSSFSPRRPSRGRRVKQRQNRIHKHDVSRCVL